MYAIWFTRDMLEQVLTDLRPELQTAIKDRFYDLLDRNVPADLAAIAYDVHNHESVVAGTLAYLYERGQTTVLRDLFFPPRPAIDPEDVQDFNAMIDPLTTFDPRTELDRVTLSPIGVVNLFRQYFFEFATFLGPSVQHIWLSPGGTVELVEISTRRTLIERTVEQAFESAQKTEKSLTRQDELADAVKQENQSNTKFAMGLDTSSTFTVGLFTAQVGTSTSYELDTSTTTAREHAHKQLRQQSDKVSSEIKRNFKSTFRTVTETQDTSSKRYVLQNDSKQLVNYELRRKMRQVGVQVQDLGTHLCWQTYVDKPGDELGMARLVHIAKPPDLSTIANPDALPQPEPELMDTPRMINLEWPFGDPKYIFQPVGGLIHLSPPKAGYIYHRHELIVTEGHQWAWVARPHDHGKLEIDTGRGDGSTETSIRTLQVGVQPKPGNGLHDPNRPRFTLQLTVWYRPAEWLFHHIEAENKKGEHIANEAVAQAHADAFFKAARDRVKAASNVEPRRFEDLREEERTIVYRHLIRQLLNGVGMDAKAASFGQVRHVLAELIEALFDIDKMLYFVAPEWWVPRNKGDVHRNPQVEGVLPEEDDEKDDAYRVDFDDMHTVDWGGPNAKRPDNYYITENSTPARLGSSLGWMLQLDGDNFRNAFVNAPWVKAVIPIRAGKELAALNWLTRASVEGSDGLEAFYRASDEERERIVATLRAYPWEDDDPLKTRYATLAADDLRIQDAIRYLAIRVQAKAEQARKPVTDEADPSLSYLPTDRVYERGFYPLPGGFQVGNVKPFVVHDQWVEVVPTDQIVAVEVRYNPQTGQLEE